TLIEGIRTDTCRDQRRAGRFWPRTLQRHRLLYDIRQIPGIRLGFHRSCPRIGRDRPPVAAQSFTGRKPGGPRDHLPGIPVDTASPVETTERPLIGAVRLCEPFL